MNLKALIEDAGPLLKRHWRTMLSCPALVLAAASCVPAGTIGAPGIELAQARVGAVPPAAVIDQSEVQAITGEVARTFRLNRRGADQASLITSFSSISERAQAVMSAFHHPRRAQ
jgi:hypothetical protein